MTLPSTKVVASQVSTDIGMKDGSRALICKQAVREADSESENTVTKIINHDEAENEQINVPGHILLNRHVYAICGPDVPPGKEIKGEGRTGVESTNCRYWRWPLYNDFKEILKDSKESWPPAFVNLQDWHILQICRADIAYRQCCALWPGDFNSKGVIHTRRKPKGRAGKVMYNGSRHYALVCSDYQLSGDEAGQVVILLPPNTDAPAGPQLRTTIGIGQRCEVQQEFAPDLEELQYGMYTNRLSGDTLSRRPLNNCGDWGPENRIGRPPQIKGKRKTVAKKEKKDTVSEEPAKVNPKKEKGIAVRGNKDLSEPIIGRFPKYRTIARY